MSTEQQPTTFFWFRRDLRLDDNHGLYQALSNAKAVQCLFIFDSNILEELQDRQDASCLLYTSPSPRDGATSRMPSSA